MQYIQLSFSFFQWIIVSIRSICLMYVLGMNYLAQSFLIYISSLFPFQMWRRYISSVINLIMNRIALLVLGYFILETENFKFFSRIQQKITLKSGYIAIATHKNIIDFLYYTCIFNPTFVRLILIVDKDQNSQKQFVKKINYVPLDHSQALKCAFQNRGFDPIIVRNQKELKSLKYRKTTMKSLVSECFQQLKGAIFILLPGMKMHQHIQIDKLICNDIYENELKFLRSGVGLRVNFQDREVFENNYKSQIHFLLSLMSELSLNRLSISSLTFRNYRHQYSRQSYRDFMEENFFLLGQKTVEFRRISYIDYLKQRDDKERELAEKGE